MNRQLSRAIIGAGGLIGLGFAVGRLPGDEVLLVARSLACIGVTGCAAYAIHQIKGWATDIPGMPSPSQLLAVSQDYGPHLAGEVAQAECAEIKAEPDDNHRQTELAIIRFCINGEWYQSFSYREMHYHCDRPTWDRITGYLAEHGVLRIGSGRRPTWFAGDWNSVRVRVALKRGELPLPTHPESVPVVVWADYRHAMHASKQANTQTY
jgi:hypothetical protein